jgi:hypothetical protein
MRMNAPQRRRIDNPVGLAGQRRARSLRWEYLWRSLWHRLPALLPALLFVPIVMAPPLNHDVAAVLQFSQRWLAGEHLYTDLIDVNPPLIFVLNLIPASIAAITPLNAVAALRLCLLVYGGFCWWLALRVRNRRSEGPVERSFLDVLPGLVLLVGAFEFGQREHLMAVAAVPYILGASRRAAGETPRGQIAVGLLAGVAFALKPHFLGVPALIELYVLLARRPEAPLLEGLAAALRRSMRDPVLWLIAGVWTIYLASLPLLFADYLNTVLPLVWGFYLDLGNTTPWQMLLTPRMGAVMLLLAPLLLITWRQRSLRAGAVGDRLAPLFALASVAAVAAALVQHKGWSYHLLPIQLFACALGGVLGAQWCDRLRVTIATPAPHKVSAVIGGLFALFVISNGEAPWKEFAYPNGEVAELTARLEGVAEGERVLVLSPAIYPIFPALNYAGIQATLRTMNMWLLEGAYHACLPDGRRYREVWEMGRPEFFVYRTVSEDFARSPPAAVLVDTDPGIPWCGGQFDFIDYFKRHPLFAEVWSHYQLTAQWSHYRLYTPKD